MISSGLRLLTLFPIISISPEVGLINPDMQLKVVDLPQPFGPINPTNSPFLISNEMSLIALRPPKSCIKFEIFIDISVIFFRP